MHQRLRIDIEYRGIEEDEFASADLALSLVDSDKPGSVADEPVALLVIRHHPDGADRHDPAGSRWEIVPEQLDDDSGAFRSFRRYRPTFYGALDEVLSGLKRHLHDEWVNLQVRQHADGDEIREAIEHMYW